MTRHWLVGLAGWLLLAVTCQANIVNFESGLEYVYHYNSTVEMKGVQKMIIQAKVIKL